MAKTRRRRLTKHRGKAFVPNRSTIDEVTSARAKPFQRRRELLQETVDRYKRGSNGDLRNVLIGALADQIDPGPMLNLNFDQYAATRLRIKDKSGKIVPMVMNKIQYDMNQRFEAAGNTARILTVKPRQVGSSTYWVGRLTERINRKYLMSGEGLQGVVIADSSENTAHLVEMLDRFLINLPPQERPFRKGRYPNGIRFPDIDSIVYMGTAGNRTWGRSKTVHFVLGSEVAFFPDAKKLFDGLSESVPATPDIHTCIVKESTANGASGYFYEEVQKALRGDSEWKVFFYPWWWQPEYQLPIPPRQSLKLTDEERKLYNRVKNIDGIKLTKNQLLWRRKKIQERQDIFWQEYPEDIDTCFLASGRPRFDISALKERLDDQVADPVFEDYPINKGGETVFQIRIYEEALSGQEYVIGADPSEGIQMADQKDSTDYSAAVVRHRANNRQVATIHGRLDPFEFAYLLTYVGTYYNNALIGVERNNHGHAVLGYLVHGTGDGTVQPYPNIYIHSKAIGGDDRPGWPTTSRTRPIMIEDLALEYRIPSSYIIRDRAIIREGMSFVRHPNGSYAASEGAYDDLVMADAIAGQMRVAPVEERSVEYNPVRIGEF